MNFGNQGLTIHTEINDGITKLVESNGLAIDKLPLPIPSGAQLWLVYRFFIVVDSTFRTQYLPHKLCIEKSFKKLNNGQFPHSKSYA